jgi:hypothetical protein
MSRIKRPAANKSVSIIIIYFLLYAVDYLLMEYASKTISIAYRKKPKPRMFALLSYK